MARRALLALFLAVGGGSMVLVASVARENAGTCGECTSNKSTFVRPFPSLHSRETMGFRLHCSGHIVVTTTSPTEELARVIASTVVQLRLAGCAQEPTQACACAGDRCPTDGFTDGMRLHALGA